jgi:hypothetical protein
MYLRILSLIFIIALSACNQDSAYQPSSHTPTLAERYPGPWHEEFNADIARALAAKSITGCGQFKFKASSQDSGEYVVYCTRDGESWVAYLVWTKVNEVIGPNQTDPSLN